MSEKISQLDTDRIIEAIRVGRLVPQAIVEGGQLKYWALVPSGQAQTKASDARTPPPDPRRTRPL